MIVRFGDGGLRSHPGAIRTLSMRIGETATAGPASSPSLATSIVDARTSP